MPHPTTAAATNQGLATATAISGGIRLSFSAVDATQSYKLTVLMCAGDSQAFVGSSSATSTPGSETGVGFEADFVLTQSISGSIGAAVSYGNDATPGFGAAINGASITQAAIIEGWEQLQSDADGSAETDRFAGNYNAGAGELVQITAFGADGWNHVADTGSPTYVYLAVKLSDPGRRFGVAMEALPGSGGPTSFTGLGFKPAIALLGANLLTASDTATDGPTVSTFGLGCFSAASLVEGSAAMAQDEGAGTAATVSMADSKAIHLEDEVGTSAVVGTYNGSVTDGFSINLSTATVGRMVVFGIGFPAAFDETVAISDASLLVESALLANETVNIEEGLHFHGFLVTGETVNIEDGFVFEQDSAIPIMYDRRGRTTQGGAIRGKTVQSGSEQGQTI